MSLLLSRSSLRPVLVRSSPSLLQCRPFSIRFAHPCGNGLGKPVVWYADDWWTSSLEKKVPLELVEENIGSSHGWIATLKDDGIVRLHDDLNLIATDSIPRCISLPPLPPPCQTRIATNVAMSSSSPEDEDCVVAIKFLGNQLSFCRPAQTKPEWINITIENPCFFSSHVMFSKKEDMFRIPGSGGHIIGSWDPRTYHHKPKVQRLRYLDYMPHTMRKHLDSLSRREHFVESRSTGETFLVKSYKKTHKMAKSIRTEFEDLLVFKVDEKGNAVYTEDIGDLCIFLSDAEPFCVPASSFPRMSSNRVYLFDADEDIVLNLAEYTFEESEYDPENCTNKYRAPYHIPPFGDKEFLKKLYEKVLLWIRSNPTRSVAEVL